MARRSSSSSSNRAWTVSCIAGSKTTARSPPSFRATDLAMSAFRSSLRASASARRCRGDAQARGHVRRDAGEVDGLPDGGQDALRPGERIGRCRVAVEQDPRTRPRRVARTCRRRQRGSPAGGQPPGGPGRRPGAPGCRSSLEAVEAKRGTPSCPIAFGGACQRLPHPVVKQGAIREVGQEVMEGNLGELSLERLAFPDVARP